MIKSWLTPAAPSLYFSKNDPHDLRLGDLFKPLTSDAQIKSPTFALLGYPDDEGIKLNGGRPGAAEGPDAIRKVLYKMTPSLREMAQPTAHFVDAGNLIPTASLSERHVQARQTVKRLLELRAHVITLGGGHDYGFSDMAAFCEQTLQLGQRPFIINFDAHLDVRPDERGENSGTPFYRLLNEYAGQIEFFEVGIQDWCNARAHFKWAKERGAQIITLEELTLVAADLTEALSRTVLRHVKPHHRVGLSVDIDCFSSSSCPGASQVFPTGFMANDFLKAWRPLVKLHQPAITSFYEVSPPFDLDQRTSRMAAILIHQRLFAD